MCNNPVKKEETTPKTTQIPAENKKPEGSNWDTSTPPGYREEM